MPAIFTHPPFVASVSGSSGSSSSLSLLASVARVAPIVVESSALESVRLPEGCEYWVSLASGADAQYAVSVLDAGASRIVTRDAELAASLDLAERVILKIDGQTSTLLSQPGVIDSVAGLLVELPAADQAQLLASFRESLGGKKKADSKLLFFVPPAGASLDETTTMSQLDSKAVPCVYTENLSSSQVATLFTSGLKTDRTDGLFATLVAGTSGDPLGLVYSSQASLAMSVESGDAIYYSRSRNSLWKKGETSGATQRVRRIRIDCDADALQFEVEQKIGTGFCQ